MADDTVLITGCASGIGRETALTFRESGWNVAATDPNPEEMQVLADRGCTTLELDVTEEGDASEAVGAVVDEYGGVDCLFNNAGYGQIGPLEELPTEKFAEQFEVNVFGHHRLARAVLPVMRRRGGGTIVNMSSVYGRTVGPGQGAYSASKWAVEAFSDTLRIETAEHGIDVVTIEPGPVETRFGEHALAQRDDLEQTGAYGWFDRLYSNRRALDKAPGHVQPRRVADTVLDAATSQDPRRRYVVGPWKYGMLAGYLLPDAVRDWIYRLVTRYA